jgi:hypothetical protein
MPHSAQDALILARTSIDAARDARGSEGLVAKHYQTAKKALDKVDIKKTENAALEDIITAFTDLAQVLDDSGSQFQERAAKCRQKAATKKYVPSFIFLALTGLY